MKVSCGDEEEDEGGKDGTIVIILDEGVSAGGNFLPETLSLLLEYCYCNSM